MFQKVLIAEDMDFINSGIKAELAKLGIKQIDYVQYCDEALLKLKRASLDNEPYDLLISDLSFEKDAVPQKNHFWRWTCKRSEKRFSKP